MTAPIPAQATVTPSELRGQVLDRVEDRLGSFIDFERERWSTVAARAATPIDAIASLIRAGGKRLRPAFCASGFLAAGGDPGDALIVEVSAALELLHAFALIQDDVLDNSPLRRGATTVHVRCADEHRLHGWRGEARRYGEGVAVLAGDLAFAYADRLMSSLPPRAREVWDELRTELIVGQYLDIAAAAEFLVDPALCRWIALCKSGRYTIYRPLALGAAIAGRHDLIPMLAAYGLAVGEAFQLRDDLIGAFGDSKVTGKPAGLDFDQQKMTLMLALAVQRDERVRRLVAAGGEGSWDAVALRPLLIEIGVRDEVERSIAQLVERASAALAEAAIDRGWREELASMALQVAYRDR